MENVSDDTSTQYEFLLLATMDMEEARSAAQLLIFLMTEKISGYPGHIHQLEKALETSVCVSYARAFTQTNFTHDKKPLNATDVNYLDTEQKLLHEKLIELRMWRYAHTDRSSHSQRHAQVLNGGDGVAGFSESWVALDKNTLDMIIKLCDLNRDQWREKIPATK